MPRKAEGGERHVRDTGSGMAAVVGPRQGARREREIQKKAQRDRQTEGCYGLNQH